MKNKLNKRLEDCMAFPRTWKQFVKDYQLNIDGSKVLPTFRVEQMIHNYFNYKAGSWCSSHITPDGISEELCSNCEHWSIGKDKIFCPRCGSKNIPNPEG